MFSDSLEIDATSDILQSESMLSKRRSIFKGQHKNINKGNQKVMCQYLYGMIQILMHPLLTKEKDTRQKNSQWFIFNWG
jgi:hypothetical protein